MARTQITQSVSMQTHKPKRFRLSIGLRLSLALTMIILLTGLIGLLAIQQFSSLRNTTTELNAHDLPEAMTLVHLRSLLYWQRDFEHSLINGISPNNQATATSQPEDLPAISASTPPGKQIQQTMSELALVLKEIAADRQQLFTFESSSQRNARDFPQVKTLANGVLQTSALSQAIQAFVTKGQYAQARMIDIKQLEPLRVSTNAAVTQLVTIEQGEASIVAAQAQQESARSTLFVFALTALCLLLSMALAIIITRSLTRPLNVLLHSTEEIAAGNLNVKPRVNRSDEIGRLASAYDKMRLSLRSTIASLSLERQQTQAAIDASADGIIVIDEALRIVKCNPATEHLTRWQAKEAIGKYCWEVLGFKAADVQNVEINAPLHSLLTALQTRMEQSYIEMLIASRTGQERWFALSCAPVPQLEKE
ncbi:MAG: HAMP domain-containing protein [Ktedonobacteraceae bacterium]